MMPTISPGPTSQPTTFESTLKDVTRGGTWSCTDRTKCVEYDCPEKEAAYRSGHLCHDWPWYNGGYPMSPLKYQPGEKKQQTCFTAHNSTCTSWDMVKIASDYIGYTTCACDHMDPRPNYDMCEKWQCHGISVKVSCSEGGYDCGGYIVLHDDLGYYEGCCYDQYDEEDNYLGTTFSPRSVWPKDAICEVIGVELNPEGTDTNTYYMRNWHCEEKSPGGISFKDYVCDERNVEGYCEDYKWETDSKLQFENSGCVCDYAASSGSTSYCAYYDCKSQGMNKITPNLGFIALGILVSPLAAFCLCLLGDQNGRIDWSRNSSIIVLLVIFIFHAGIQVITAFGGGLAAFFISEAVVFGIFLVVLGIFCLNSSPFSKTESSPPKHTQDTYVPSPRPTQDSYQSNPASGHTSGDNPSYPSQFTNGAPPQSVEMARAHKYVEEDPLTASEALGATTVGYMKVSKYEEEDVPI